MSSLNNTDGPLQVPGFGPIPLNYELPPKTRFAHGLVEYRHSPRLTMREMAMLRVMQYITEQPGWDQALLATEGFLISAPAWDWCIAELRDKAQAWQETGRLLVFDSSSTVCQANVPLPQKDIQAEIARLGTQASHDSPLVDPSEFPLVYDRSPVLVEGGRVSLDDPWLLTGQTAKELPVHPLDQMRRPREWLPCEVEFASPTTPTPDDTTDVRITSYVNNLHPHHNQNLYAHLERLIACSIPSWNEILFYGEARGRHPHEWQEKCDQVREYVLGPEPPVWKQARRLPKLPANLLESLTTQDWEDPRRVNMIARYKRIRRAWFEHPEPGVSFSYEQWKNGEFTGRAIFPQRIGNFPDPLHHDYLPVCLQEKFQKDGLQVIVQISRIGLSPESPNYQGEAYFHTEGLRNEHIVATTMYVVEAENITLARVAFQHEDKVHASEFECEEPDAMSEVLDVDYWESYEETPPRGVHTFGSVQMIEGHLLSWPNTLRSKQEPFTLANPHQPGHLTVIKLRLVDPHYRICSTGNVPPQQHDWWAAEAQRASNLDARLPPELVHLVMEQTNWWPMSTAEARRLREDLRRDHQRAQEAAEKSEGYHLSALLPYDSPTDATESTGVTAQSP
ncbi:hypothetical protein N7449_001326 [Penicillium cf. viridicatum]|uniref:Uncharacterized protein n=1 Tax=Penicillium cf. viridicatum TaxID=2972119 RepID=A0A9W9T957_9EURO|nr:hypothetical protein N7449_001326 [Penicillium cf. viridicatum]